MVQDCGFSIQYFVYRPCCASGDEQGEVHCRWCDVGTVSSNHCQRKPNMQVSVGNVVWDCDFYMCLAWFI